MVGFSATLCWAHLAFDPSPTTISVLAVLLMAFMSWAWVGKLIQRSVSDALPHLPSGARYGTFGSRQCRPETQYLARHLRLPAAVAIGTLTASCTMARRGWRAFSLWLTLASSVSAPRCFIPTKLYAAALPPRNCFACSMYPWPLIRLCSLSDGI